MDQSQLNEIRAKVNIPNQLANAAKRIVQAGRKVMFSKESRKLVMDALSGDAPIENRIGKAVGDLMALLWFQSNKSMPPQLIAPCATLLAIDAIEFMTEAGEQFDAGTALEVSVVMTMDRFGVKADTVEQHLKGITKEMAGQAMAMPPKRGGPVQPQKPGMIQGA